MADTSEEINAQELKAAREVIQAFLRARKTLKLYPANNPIYVKTVEDAFVKLKDYFDHSDKLELKISRNDITVGSEPVFTSDSKEENIALMFFRDGLRGLTFEKDIEPKEYQDFLNILAVDFDSESIEEDMVTLLWEKDFQHIHHKVDENVLVEDEQYEEQAVEKVKEESGGEDNVKQAYADALGEDLAMPIAPITIEETDLKVLISEIEKDGADKKGKLIDILFDMVYTSDSLDEFKDVVRIINNAIEFCIRNADLKNPITIMKRVAEIVSKTQSADVKKALSGVMIAAGNSEVIKSIGDLLDAKTEVYEADFAEYVGFLGANSIPNLINVLGSLQGISGRKCVINALVSIGKKDINSLVKSLKDDRWYVVRNIIHILRQIGDPRVVDFLVKSVGHEDVRVRKEVIKALGELGGQKAVETVHGFIFDPDPSIRSIAIRALGASGADYGKWAVIERLSDRRIETVPFNEVKEAFEVLSRWKDKDVKEFLTGIIKKNPFFGRAKYSEYKACAVYCMGLVGSQSDIKLLEGLLSSKEKMLVEYSTWAIKRIRYAKQQ